MSYSFSEKTAVLLQLTNDELCLFKSCTNIQINMQYVYVYVLDILNHANRDVSIMVTLFHLTCTSGMDSCDNF